MGLPGWPTIRSWLADGNKKPLTAPRKPAKPKSFPDIPVLEDYSAVAPKDFWDRFPSSPLPTEPSTPIDADKLEAEVFGVWDALTSQEKGIADKTINDLRFGADAGGATRLGGCFSENSEAVYKHGEAFTDLLASWVSKGYVAGPFSDPPFESFRVNPLKIVEQKDKIRPVLNMSAPAGLSYNDAIKDSSLRKVRMASAGEFGMALKEYGKSAKFSKLDWSDAYKQLAVNQEALRLQVFSWLGMFWVECRLIFGSCKAVVDFDGLADTVEFTAAAKSGFPRSRVSRTLDDMGAAGNGYASCWPFIQTYLDLCKAINAPLAPLCPKREKAFIEVDSGTVLGFQFSAPTGEWSISLEKAASYDAKFRSALEKGCGNLQAMQGIAGVMEHICSLMPLAKAFRDNLYAFIRCFKEDTALTLRIPPSLRRDLATWLNFIRAAWEGLPIPSKLGAPGPMSQHFLSDAAGLADSADIGIGQLGVAAVRTDSELASTTEACRIWWPARFIEQLTDDSGTRFGNKTSTLECVGLLLPFLHRPMSLQNSEVTLWVDNAALCFGWKKKFLSGDKEATLLLRCLTVIGAKLGCRINVQHAPRRSSSAARAADDLSRTKSSHSCALRPSLVSNKVLESWLANPSLDWSLPLALADSLL